MVANRGEIALRILRACQSLDIATVVVYSEADSDSLPVRVADEAVCIGPPSPQESYLNIARIIEVAKKTGSEAIHPGYGFLAENPEFSEVCEAAGLIFIGPSTEVIKAMGNKVKAKEIMGKAGLPVIPGTPDLDGEEEAFAFVQKVGYPLVVKASAGGGGRGMRIINRQEDLLSFLKMASAEAKAAFGQPQVYLEKYLFFPRHIEFQILADSEGNTIHLGERDCSIQRRYQKLVEEAPAPLLTESLREEIGALAVKAARDIGYQSCGTIEFLMDSEGHYYFMEMNTRIQVEHPVTEVVTGIDLVKEQIKIAAGGTLSFSQGDVEFKGHGIEFRINAEDPERNFLPSPGKIEEYIPPKGEGIRVDSHLFPGINISPYYDSLLAKLIVKGESRKQALERSKKALRNFVIGGVKTTLPFHLKLVEDEKFEEGEVSTQFGERLLDGKKKS